MRNSPLSEDILNAAAENRTLCCAATQTGTKQREGIKRILTICPAGKLEPHSWLSHWLDYIYIRVPCGWATLSNLIDSGLSSLLRWRVGLEVKNWPCLPLRCGLTRRWEPVKPCSASSQCGWRKLELLPANGHRKHQEKSSSDYFSWEQYGETHKERD